MKMEVFYEQPGKFSHVISKIQRLLIDLKQKTKDKFEKDVITYIQNRLTEINFQIYFSYLLNEASVYIDKPIVINDIDKVIRVNSNFKAIFELKVRRRDHSVLRNKCIRVPYGQWNTLKLLSEKLNVPVFYLIKLPDDIFKLIKLNFWRTELINYGNPHVQGTYVSIPLNEGLTLNETELINILMDILR